MSRWTRHESLDGDACYYCGRPGGQEDHFPGRFEEGAFPEIPGSIVRACGTCNNLAQDSRCKTLEERRGYVKRFRRAILSVRVVFNPEGQRPAPENVCRLVGEALTKSGFVVSEGFAKRILEYKVFEEIKYLEDLGNPDTVKEVLEIQRELTRRQR